MGQARGKCSQGYQLVALTYQGLGVGQSQEQPVEKVHRHREPSLQEVGKVLRRQLEQAGARHRPKAGGVRLISRGAAERSSGPCICSRSAGRRQHHVGAVEPLHQLDLAVQEDEERLGDCVLDVHVNACVVRFDGAVVDEPVQLLIGEALEEEAPAKLLLEPQRCAHNRSR